MSKVEWITWKTDPKEIINPTEIEETIQSNFQEYTHYMNPVIYEPLKQEIKTGGLSKDAFNVGGYSPSNDIAIDIINKIEEIKISYTLLLKKIREEAINQKEIEKRQLISAITEQIKRDQDNIRILSNNRQKNENEILILKNRIKRLEEKKQITYSL